MTFQGKLLKAFDGDTILIQVGTSTRLKVRLSRVDSPEKGQNFLGTSEDAGLFSHRCLMQLAPTSGVLFVEGFDLYGRVLGDFAGLNARLIEAGCCGLYPFTSFSSRWEKTRYLVSLNKARDAGRGVWGKSGYLLPKEWRRRARKRSEPPRRRR